MTAIEQISHRERGGGGRFRRGIGLRLLVSILLFSSLVTLVLTAVQLYLDYRTELEDIRGRFDEIGKSYLGGLSSSLWSLDVDQIRLLIEGIKHLPDMTYIEVRETGRPHRRQAVISVGEHSAERILFQDYPILFSPYQDHSDQEPIGVLYVEASLDGVYSRIGERAVAILVSQGVKTFLVSAFTLFIVHRLVTRHLIALSGLLRGYRLGRPVWSVALTRHPPRFPDELDDLTSALNGMSASLTESIESRETALRRLRLQETALDRAYRHFTTQETAAKLAHEIKQPLACVSTYVQGLQSQLAEGKPPGDDLPLLVDRIAREVLRVREIIAASQARMVSPSEAFEPLFLGEVLRDVLPLLRQICDDASVVAWMDVVTPGPSVRGSRASLQQVVVNLVRNACEAMSGRGGGRNRLWLTMSETDGRACFSVLDNGPGFPRDVIRTGHALFSSAKRRGSGFGLPIADAILKAHQGGMELANDESGGGHVTCWLPKISMREG